MMSLSSLLNLGPTVPSLTPIDDRGEHYSYSPPWKGSGGGGKKKGSQSALSALTLLAFLFFLNMLQSCLNEQMQNNAPIVMMMTTSTTTSTVTGQRLKREDFTTAKGDAGHSNFTKIKTKCSPQDCQEPLNTRKPYNV